MDSDYAHFGRTGDKLPWFTGIVLKDVGIEGGGKLTLQGYDAEHRLGMSFDNVQFDAPEKIKVLAEHALLKFGPPPANLKFAGDDVTVMTSAGGRPLACADKFVPIPSR